jgi:hypothetical protein
MVVAMSTKKFNLNFLKLPPREILPRSIGKTKVGAESAVEVKSITPVTEEDRTNFYVIGGLGAAFTFWWLFL